MNENQKKQLDDCSPELRPALARFQETVNAMLAVLPQPNRLRAAIVQLEERLATAHGEEAVELRRTLERLDTQLAEAERAFEEVKAAHYAAVDAYQAARFEWRVAQAPEARREEARALLREEEERLSALLVGAPTPVGAYGAAGMEVERLSASLSKARRAGDWDATTKHEAELAAARARLEELQPDFDAHKQAQQNLTDEYERRLRALADGGN